MSIDNDSLIDDCSAIRDNMTDTSTTNGSLNNDSTMQYTANATDEDYSHTLPIPPTPPSPSTAKSSFFSRMSSLGSSAAPILEQVYDRAHKKAAALKETNTLREAVDVVRSASGGNANRDEDASEDALEDGSEDDSISNEEEEEDADESVDGEHDAQDTGDITTARSPMKAVMGVYSEFRTTGRYQRKKEEADADSSSISTNNAESPRVGGADRVPGLGRLKLNNLVSMVGTSLTNTANEDEKSIATVEEPVTPKTTYKRTNSYYEEAVKNLLQPNQRALFFGKGTMGVILKPTYLASWRGKDGGGLVSPSTKNKGGVFIDALIPGGHAERSKVVFVGDHVVKIGNVDVRNMTLEEVVKTIADAERPSIMILMAEWDIATVQTQEEKKRYFVSPLDLAFGYVNKIAVEGVEGRKETHAAMSTRNSLLDEDDQDAEEVLFGSDSPVKVLNGGNHNQSTETHMPNNTAHVDAAKDIPQDNELESLFLHASQRTNGHEDGDGDQATVNNKHHQYLPAILARAAFLNPILRSTLHEAFKECSTDPRKANFLEHFYSEYTTKKELEARAKCERDKANGKKVDYAEDENDATSSTNQKKLLDIYFRLIRFHNEATVCSTKQLLESARFISGTFLPDADIDTNQNMQTVPEYVAYIAFGGTENLQSLKRALTDEDEFFEDADHDGFHKCREELGIFLSNQSHFLAFLVSDDCARMRAYLRGTSPFVCVEPSLFLNTSSTPASSSFLLFAILHLVCMKEPTDQILETSDEYGNFIRMDTMLTNQRNGKRVAGAASILICPIFIMRNLNKSLKQAAEGLVEDEMMGSYNNVLLYTKLANDVRILWENFVSPVSGALVLCSLSDATQSALDAFHNLLSTALGPSTSKGVLNSVPPSPSLIKSLTTEEFLTALQDLCDALIQDYCKDIFPNLQRHIFHEWALTEAANTTNPTNTLCKLNEYLVPNVFYGLPRGYAKKVLRQIDLPNGVSSHLPGPKRLASLGNESGELSDSYHLHNADIAIVFSKQVEDDLPKPASDLSANSTTIHSNIQRHACSFLHPKLQSNETAQVLYPADIPDSFEEYMGSPPFRDRPFKGMLRIGDSTRISIDGWEVSLTNSMIPLGKGSSDMMYCVSLTFSNVDTPAAEVPSDDQILTDTSIEELHYDSSVRGNMTLPQCKVTSFQSPIYVERNIRKMKVSSELSAFNQELKEKNSSKARYQQQMIGISLVSKRNVIPAMRETLQLIYDDLCSVGGKYIICQPFIQLLSVISSSKAENESLKCIIESYTAHAASQWIHRPLRDQSEDHVALCGIQVIQSLPPVPLALLFVTAFLEQKIVFSSSRRSMLVSASMALSELINPLKWTHLLVPHAPISMVNDLIHYPAPFILGLSTDEKQSARILRSLPSDVTLVDLDVGRVMLASEFVNDDIDMDDDTRASSQSALRSQALVLAEFLGGVFGSAIHEESWCCDSVLPKKYNDASRPELASKFSRVCSICHDFLGDLISGISSCCLWIEENSDNLSNIVFDEDQFMHIKKSEDNMNKICLGQFNLILHAFLRTQSLSTLINEGNKQQSLFS